MDATLSRLDRRSSVTLWVLENNDPAIGFMNITAFAWTVRRKALRLEQNAG